MPPVREGSWTTPPCRSRLTPMQVIRTLACVLCCALASAVTARAAMAANGGASHQIHVSLFGQPCLLQGPVDEAMLKLIHSLSPEQLYPDPDAAATAAPTRKAVEKLRAVTGAPAALDRYRDRLAKRLEAQLALLDALDAFRKDHRAEAVAAVGKAHLNSQHLKDFVAALRKAEGGKPADSALDAVVDAYNDGIEADPEEEFHRAIQRIGVQYACSFEEGGGGEPDAQR